MIAEIQATKEKNKPQKQRRVVANIVPTRKNLSDPVETETGFEIEGGPKGRPRKRFICIAYGLEGLDEEVLIDIKILDSCKNAPPQYTSVPKTRDTGEVALRGKMMYLKKGKPSGFEWIIESLVMCTSTVSKGKRRREDSGSDVPIGNISDSMTLYGKKRVVYSASETSLNEAHRMPPNKQSDSDCPNGQNSAKCDRELKKEIRTEHSPADSKKLEVRGANTKQNLSFEDSANSAIANRGGKQESTEDTGWQIVRHKGKRRKLTNTTASIPTEVGRKTRMDRQLPERSSNQDITSGKLSDKKEKEKKLKTEKHRSDEKDNCPEHDLAEDPCSSIALDTLSVSDNPKRVTRSSIIKAPPLPTGKTYHVFFSYRYCKHDRQWVRRIIERLESPRYNYKCCIHDRDFMPGHTIIGNIADAIKTSLRVAVVLTDEYIESYWCNYEATIVREPGLKACIVPLILKECSIPQSLKDLTCITVSENSDEWWALFLKALKGVIPYLPSSKSEHVFLFHDDVSEEDKLRVENVRSALETSAYSFRCISRDRDFDIGRPVEENVHECAKKAVTTIFALSSNFPDEKWLHHWHNLRQKGIRPFPLTFDRFELPHEFKEITIFDATSEQKSWLPKLIPTKQNLKDTAENETGFEIKSSQKGRSSKKRFICIAYGLEELDEIVLTDLKILSTYEKDRTSQEYTLVSRTRDTGEGVLEDRHLYLRWKKLSGYEWVIDYLMICPSTASQGKRGEGTSEAIAWAEYLSIPTEEDKASDSPQEENAVGNDKRPTEKFQTDQGAASISKNSTVLPTTTVQTTRPVMVDDSKIGEACCQTTQPKDEVERKWQEIRRKKKNNRRLAESSSDSVMTTCGINQEGKGMSRKKKKKRKKSGQFISATEATISQEKPREDSDPSLSFHMLNVSESPIRVARRSITEAPPLPRGKTYHVFFSFRNSQNDKDWVREVIERLESPPHSYLCCFADRDFIPGETVISNIEMAVKQSVRVAVVLTEEYIKSYWCKYEASVIREPGCKACIIPLQLNNCRIPQSLKDLSFIPVSNDNDKWWETLLRSLNGKIPYLPPTKSDHIFLFHGTSEKDMERTENLRSALETCACSFRCISSGRDFVYGSTVKENVHMCVTKAATTVFALTKDFPKDKWLQHWQELRQRGFKLFPLMFDHFDLPKELQDIVIFDATREQNIWLPRLIDNLMQ
ncbi:hypothetical protein ACJMK2_039315 [Sinanodonta woodiana]|uniref:TIR domain-containing protein n=1 Tax=Sinanodonta woodiana TaxID=1069815 RepID=A0ABD3WDM0_SINWO